MNLGEQQPGARVYLLTSDDKIRGPFVVDERRPGDSNVPVHKEGAPGMVTVKPVLWFLPETPTFSTYSAACEALADLYERKAQDARVQAENWRQTARANR